MASSTFPRSEHLKSRKKIALLFKKGNKKHFKKGFLLLHLPFEEGSYVMEAGFSVPKKKFAKAVDRNRLKRRLKEAYRLQKYSLTEHLKEQKINAGFMLIYTANQMLPFDQVYTSMAAVINELENFYGKTP